MSVFYGHTKRDDLSVSVSSSMLDIDALLVPFDSDPELRDSLKAATVLIVPTERSQEHEGPIFPTTTYDVFRHLREGLGGLVTVDAAIRDEDYEEFEFFSEDIILPILYIADPELLLVIVRLLAAYLKDRLKGRGGPKAEDRVQSELHYRNQNGTELSLKYDGPADTFEEAISRCLRESGSFTGDSK